MNIRILGIVALFAIVVALAGPIVAQSVSTIAKGYPASFINQAVTGFQTVATPTITLSDTAVKIGKVPAGTVAVSLIGKGAFNYGDSSVKNSTAGDYLTVADKAAVTIPLYPGTLEPNIYVCNNATGASPIVRIVAHVQR
jgi:hypothetical protein